MIPLALTLLSQFLPSAPSLIGALIGPKAGQVAQDIVSAAETITGVKGDDAVSALKSSPALLAQYQATMASYQLEALKAELAAQTEVIVAETKSESWITRNWRPITMLTFTGLVVMYWIGWTAPNLTKEEVLSLLEIVKYGLSGYVVGRSAEKIAPSIASIFSRK